MASLSPELSAHLEIRNIWNAAFYPERAKSSIVLGSDIEGPWFKGDFIAEAMASKLKPDDGGINASPSYGQIIYQESWSAFTQDTLALRRPVGKRGLLKPNQRARIPSYSMSQEGTDTIFTLPFLLAEGADYNHLKELTLASTQTPGSKEMVDALERQGVFIVGITTAPQEPYRDLAKVTGFIDPKRIIGSPFPMEEARIILYETGAWDVEMYMTKAFLEECYIMIDENSTFISASDGLQRQLSAEGAAELQNRIRKYYEVELGISYDFQTRKAKKPHTITGKIIHAAEMVGDRAKAAVSQNLIRQSRGNGNVLITMGDGGNDAVMLQMAPISIGVNGPDAAKAAKIGVVTNSMVNVLPIFEQVARGERDIDIIIGRSQAAVGDAAIIHRGGSHVSEYLAGQHQRMKKELRGENITY